MRTFEERSRSDCYVMARRAMREYTKKNITKEQFDRFVAKVAELEDILDEIEEQNAEE